MEFCVFVDFEASEGMNMATRKPPQRMTKKQFVKIVTSGTLSADRAIGNMVDELQRYERK
jgi:hypothetical protein